MKTFCAFVLFGAAICMAAGDEGKTELCDGKKDNECLRKYFEKNADCSVRQENTESPVSSEYLPFYLPSINTTVITTVTKLSNMVGTVEEVFLDENTGNVVISINFPALMCDAPDSIFVIARDGLEPKVLTEYVNATYPAVITAVIQAANGIDAKAIDQAIISASFVSTDANIVFGPKITGSSDPIVQNMVSGLLADIPTALEEIFRTKATYYFKDFLQTKICDFDLPLGRGQLDISVYDAANEIDTTDSSNFEEPCAYDDGLVGCVQEYFGNSDCSVVKNPNDSPVSRKIFAVFVPWLNVTAVTNDVELTGLNGKIEKFYIDKQTKNLVMEVEFEGIVLNTPKLDVVMFKRGDIPAVASDTFEATYPARMTVVINTKNGLNANSIGNAYVSTVFHSEPKFVFGDKFMNSDDPTLSSILSGVFAKPVLTAKEVYTTEGPDQFVAYLQKYICDFGLPLAPVVQ